MSKTNNLATKTFVKETINELREELVKKMENLHGRVIDKLDSIATVIKKTDEEQIVLSHQVSEHTDQLENHEKRIKKIEESPPFL